MRRITKEEAIEIMGDWGIVHDEKGGSFFLATDGTLRYFHTPSRQSVFKGEEIFKALESKNLFASV